MSAKHFVVPHFFPAETFQGEVLPKHYLSLTKADVKRLKSLGLLECRNIERRLWSWTHLANVISAKSEPVRGGLLDLRIEWGPDGKLDGIRGSLAALMARGAAVA